MLNDEQNRMVAETKYIYIKEDGSCGVTKDYGDISNDTAEVIRVSIVYPIDAEWEIVKLDIKGIDGGGSLYDLPTAPAKSL